MRNDTHELILGMVAGLRGEKRASKTGRQQLAKSAGMLKVLGNLGLFGLAGYGGYKGYQGVKARLAPPPPPPPQPEPSMLDKVTGAVKGFASEHPVGTAAAAVGIPLLAYLGYKAFSGGDDARGRYYPYGVRM